MSNTNGNNNNNGNDIVWEIFRVTAWDESMCKRRPATLSDVAHELIDEAIQGSAPVPVICIFQSQDDFNNQRPVDFIYRAQDGQWQFGRPMALVDGIDLTTDKGTEDYLVSLMSLDYVLAAPVKPD